MENGKWIVLNMYSANECESVVEIERTKSTIYEADF